MGNLTLTADEDPDFRKGVISLWFRIPAATRATVAARTNPSLAQYDPFLKVLPLLTWGPQPSQSCANTSLETVNYVVPAPCVGPDQPKPVQSVTGSTTQYAGPSYIGVRCLDDGTMTLEVNIQTTDNPVCAGTSSLVTDWVWTLPSEGCAIPFPGCTEFESCTGITFEAVETDVSSYDQQMLEYFGNRPDVARGGVSGWGGAYGEPVISGTGRWHHLILSWDTTDGSSVTGWDSVADPFGATRGFTSLGVVASSMMWCSIDDVNKSGFNLPAMWPYYDGGVAGDANAMLSYTTMGVSSFASKIDGTASTASVSVSAIAFSPFSIPSELSATQTTGGTIVPNLKVEMAELQVYTGVTMDTSNVVNRRAFVTSTGRPETDYTIADDIFGKSPEIRLHGRSRWQAGTNLGSAGNLDPTGTIDPFTPGPSLS